MMIDSIFVEGSNILAYLRKRQIEIKSEDRQHKESPRGLEAYT